MPTFEIEQYELHTQRYRVEAESEAEAIKRLFDGEAQPVEGSLEFVDVADDLGLPVEEYAELAEALKELEVSMDDVIPSVRDIVRIEEGE